MTVSLIFSVIIPCYGHEQFVTQAVESLWAQTSDRFEIIAVEDGSPDKSGAILDQLANRSPVPMQVVHSANEGAHAALNTGAALASTPYLAFLNDDDEYASDRIAVFERVIKKSQGFQWGFSAIDPIDPDGAVIPVADVADPVRRLAIYMSRAPIEALQTLPRQNSVVTSGNLVVSSRRFKEVGGFRSLKYVHDWDLALRLLEGGAPFIVERPLYRYRLHSGNAFNRSSSGDGARIARRESEQILWQQRQREASQFMSRSQALAGATQDSLDVEAQWAVRATLWGLDRLRSIPFAYAAARRGARGLRNVRRRWVGR